MFRIGKPNGSAGKAVRRPGPGVVCERAAVALPGKQVAHLIAEFGCVNLDAGTRRCKQLRFPRSRRRPAGEHRTLAVEVKKHRQFGQRTHGRRRRVSRLS